MNSACIQWNESTHLVVEIYLDNTIYKILISLNTRISLYSFVWKFHIDSGLYVLVNVAIV